MMTDDDAGGEGKNGDFWMRSLSRLAASGWLTSRSRSAFFLLCLISEFMLCCSLLFFFSTSDLLFNSCSLLCINHLVQQQLNPSSVFSVVDGSS